MEIYNFNKQMNYDEFERLNEKDLEEYYEIVMDMRGRGTPCSCKEYKQYTYEEMKFLYG